MSWGEAVRLLSILAKDPTSQVATVVAGWDRPWSYEWAATVDVFDRMAQLRGARAKPYPRPWPDPNTKRHGRTDKSRAEVISILNAHGHRIAS